MIRERPVTEKPFTVRSVSYKPSPITWGQSSHCHKETEVILILEGQGFFTASGHTVPVQQGTILVTPPSQYHCLYSSPQMDLTYSSITLWVHSQTFLTKELQRPSSSMTNAEEYLPQLLSLIRLCFDLYKKASKIEKEASRHCILLALDFIQIAFARCSAPVSDISSDFNREQTISHQIYAYINEHFQEKITLVGLARRFSISPSHLSHLFSAQFGISPIDLQLQSRIVHSTVDLILTDLTVDEIAYRTGFDTTSNYIRQFKKRIGQTPTEFRRENFSHLIHF